MPKVTKELLMGQSIWLIIFFKRKSCEPTTHDLINMWIFYAKIFLGMLSTDETMSKK
jgi:hypothetical protein